MRGVEEIKKPNLSVTRYKKRLIKSGHVYELIEYEKEIIKGMSNNNNGRRSEASQDDSERHRRNTVSKASKTIRRLINANADAWGQEPKFLTLTFAENVQDIKTANYEFKKFRQRLEYQLKLKSLKYVVVIEFQKRGAIHYHAVFFNLPYISSNKLAEIWSNGYIKINKVKNNDNIGAYVTKYMTKEQQDKEKMEKLKGQKSYFTSRGLFEPEEIFDEKQIESLESSLKEYEVYSAKHTSEYLGDIHYKQFNLKRD